MTRAGIESSFLRTAESTRPDGAVRARNELNEPDDRYLWKWHGWDDEANLRGKIVEVNGVDCFKFTFHDPMVVSVRIVKESGINVVELTQENIPADDDSRANYFIGCGEGWTFYLANLKSILEGGLDLRNKNVEIKKVINS